MLPSALITFFHGNQEILWLFTIMADLAMTLLLFRLFGRQGLYASVIMGIILSNIQGPKLIMIFGFETSMGVILYSGIYFATDLLNERYGKREAARAVMLGFFCAAVTIIALTIAILYLPTTHPEHKIFATKVHDALAVLTNFTPRFVFGSLLAYLISQRVDVWVYDALRTLTHGRYLWLRNNGSTMVAQLVDTFIYSLVAWWGVVDLRTALMLGFVKYFLKVIIAAVDTPFIYWAHNWRDHGQDWTQGPYYVDDLDTVQEVKEMPKSQDMSTRG